MRKDSVLTTAAGPADRLHARSAARRCVAALALTAACLACPRSDGQVITLGTFTKAGGDADATASNTSASGGTMSYNADTDARNDAGFFSQLDGFTGYTFTTVGDRLEYTFTYEAITVGTNFTPQFRTGFDFGNSAVLYHMTGTGVGPELGFFANTSGNPFQTGSQVGSTVTDWSDFANQFIRFNAGNTIDATVSLTLDAINGSLFDYTYEVTYTGGGDSNTASQAFTGIAANTLDRIFHGANNANVSGSGNGWTVSNAQFVSVPEPAAVSLAAAAGLIGLGGLLLRRR